MKSTLNINAETSQNINNTLDIDLVVSEVNAARAIDLGDTINISYTVLDGNGNDNLVGGLDSDSLIGGNRKK